MVERQVPRDGFSASGRQACRCFVEGFVIVGRLRDFVVRGVRWPGSELLYLAGLCCRQRKLEWRRVRSSTGIPERKTRNTTIPAMMKRDSTEATLATPLSRGFGKKCCRVGRRQGPQAIGDSFDCRAEDFLGGFPSCIYIDEFIGDSCVARQCRDIQKPRQVTAKAATESWNTVNTMRHTKLTGRTLRMSEMDQYEFSRTFTVLSWKGTGAATFSVDRFASALS
ncbi:hypothetical protein DFH09DRAFT_1068939 [Mycena vulgaris]|nr:hypothetical protein DFH09DRAFT_1068939 [Mycena vulgaris]